MNRLFFSEERYAAAAALRRGGVDFPRLEQWSESPSLSDVSIFMDGFLYISTGLDRRGRDAAAAAAPPAPQRSHFSEQLERFSRGPRVIRRKEPPLDADPSGKRGLRERLEDEGDGRRMRGMGGGLGEERFAGWD
ncbi:hypothetical protein EYF80_026566 [Liparis tanakae]|uniref:Uncharacterized protein n=1 Tax=Liparis tanakae TaxID=230148 RepID=A0A4Z2HDY5_9TELE|nr:hypothetical protein EYF80_026566 [Liparis tanakae]